MLDEAPARLCCGLRHWGPVCPDDKVMCCLCFDRFEQAFLARDPEDGKLWDVCKGCQEQEDRAMEKKRDLA